MFNDYIFIDLAVIRNSNTNFNDFVINKNNINDLFILIKKYIKTLYKSLIICEFNRYAKLRKKHKECICQYIEGCIITMFPYLQHYKDKPKIVKHMYKIIQIMHLKTKTLKEIKPEEIFEFIISDKLLKININKILMENFNNNEHYNKLPYNISILTKSSIDLII